VLSSSKFDLTATFELSAFTRAQPVQSAKPRGFDAAIGSKSPTVPKIPGNVARLASLDELPDAVRAKTKILIAQGKDPDDLLSVDRSRLLLRVCCELVRAGVDDGVIYSIITDAEYGISAHVLAQKSGKDRCARRAIEHAKEIAIDPHLRELNEIHAVVENHGGKCRVIEEVKDPAFGGRTTLTFQAFDDFRNRYGNQRVSCGFDAKGRALEAPLGKWWLDQPGRRQYRSIVFSPGHEIEGVYNLWRGFAVEPSPGTKHHSFLAHIREDLCLDDAVSYEYLLNWMALAIQKPDAPGQVAIVLRGRKGTGKTFFAKAFGSLFGRHYWPVSDAKHIVGNFNAHLRDCVVLFGDEAFWAGDKKHESVLKTLITEDTLVIERKGIDAEAAPNYVHLIMASNAQWVVPASYDERRFLVLDVSDAHIQDIPYFAALDADLKSGGLSNLLHDLQTRDLSSFNVRTVPKTEALQEQKVHSMDSHEEWWYRKLSDGNLLPTHVGWEEPVLKDALIEDYLIYAQRLGHGKRASATTLSQFLERCAPGMKRFQAQFRGKDDSGEPVIGRALWWEFPTIVTCRQAFSKECGGPFKWPEIEVHGKAANPDPF
jgi:hypothetical protein